jgi:tetratricopeptide (TPR) repeat protein
MGDVVPQPPRVSPAGSGFDRMTGPVDKDRAVELEQQAEARYAAGDPEGSVAAWEQLYALQINRGAHLPAARAAAMVAMYLMIDTGLMAPIRGWLRRADLLIADLGETPVHAVVAMVRTYERLWCGDMATAGANATRAVDLGERMGVAPAVLVGRTAIARLRIFDGQVDEGVEMLDDIALTLMSGDVDAMTSGMVYCEVICAVQGLALYERAVEWTQAMKHWRHRAAFGGFSGRCRVHSAEMLRLTGPCDEAEQEALEACEELRPWMRREFGWPLTELGNIRLRKGDLPGAEEAFLAAHANAWAPQPGLALLRLAQGDAVAASTMINDAIEHPFDVPSKERPPYGGLRLAPLLDAQVEIAVANGNLTEARAAVDRLSEIVDTFSSQAMRASTELARGRVALAEGNAADAVARCERAVAMWIDVGAPFEAAVARMVLADARRCVGNEDAARLDWQVAQRSFEEFGAPLWAERAARAAGSADNGAVSSAVSTRSAARLTEVETNVFRCQGDTRTIQFDGSTVLIRDLKGFRYLERLLAEPNREFHVLDLIAVERRSLPTVPIGSTGELAATDGGHAGLHLDDEARDAYRRRLIDIDDDIEDATRANDLARVELAQHDRDYLVQELSRAFGLDGRARPAGATTERARTSVTRSIRYAAARVAEHHASLGQHLRQAISTGTYCGYTPDPRVPVRWIVAP